MSMNSDLDLRIQELTWALDLFGTKPFFAAEAKQKIIDRREALRKVKA